MVMLGGSKGNWVGPIIGPLKASFLSPFVSQTFLMIMAQLDSEDLAILADLMQAGTVTPVIDRRYPLSEVADAIAYIEEGHARGKVVVYMD